MSEPMGETEAEGPRVLLTVAYDGRPIAWLYTSNRELIELVEASQHD